MVVFGNAMTSSWRSLLVSGRASISNRVYLRCSRRKWAKAIKYLASVRTRAWLARGDSANSLSDGPISQTWETRSAIANPESSTCLAAFSGADQAERCLRIPVDQRDRRYREELGKLFPTTELSWGASRMMGLDDRSVDPSRVLVSCSGSSHVARSVARIGNRQPPFLRRAHLLSVYRLHGRSAPFWRRARAPPCP